MSPKKQVWDYTEGLYMILHERKGMGMGRVLGKQDMMTKKQFTHANNSHALLNYVRGESNDQD